MIPKSLQRWLVDRGVGMTSSGQTEVVVLVLRADGEERSYVMSKVDAVTLGSQLTGAAVDAKIVADEKAGYRG